MCKLMVILILCIFVKSSVKIYDVMMDNVSMNDVMIAATFHWLLLTM